MKCERQDLSLTDWWRVIWPRIWHISARHKFLVFVSHLFYTIWDQAFKWWWQCFGSLFCFIIQRKSLRCLLTMHYPTPRLRQAVCINVWEIRILMLRGRSEAIYWDRIGRTILLPYHLNLGVVRIVYRTTKIHSKDIQVLFTKFCRVLPLLVASIYLVFLGFDPILSMCSGVPNPCIAIENWFHSVLMYRQTKRYSAGEWR